MKGKSLRRARFAVQTGRFFRKRLGANVPNCLALGFPHLLNAGGPAPLSIMAVSLHPEGAP